MCDHYLKFLFEHYTQLLKTIYILSKNVHQKSIKNKEIIYVLITIKINLCYNKALRLFASDTSCIVLYYVPLV